MNRRQAEVGQRVKAGQLLAQLDPADLKLAQAAALAALRAAQSTHEFAQAEFKCYADLLAYDGARDAAFAVPEDAVAAVRALQGQPGVVQVRAWGGSTKLPARVREVAAAADPATRNSLVKADLGAAAVQLGQTATVMIDQPRLDAAITLPLSALISQHGQTAVWLLDTTSMTVKVQPVVMAGADGRR